MKNKLRNLINIGFMLSFAAFAVFGAAFYKRLRSFGDGDVSAPVTTSLEAFSNATLIALVFILIFGGIIAIRLFLEKRNPKKTHQR